MRTRLFVLFLFLLLAAALVFAGCDGNPAAPSDISSESSDLAAASSGDVSSNMPSAESDASEENSAAPSADASDAFSDASDTSSDTSDASSEDSIDYADPDFLASQLDEPFAIWEKASPITVTVENPYTDNERWTLWWGETCLYTLGEGTYVDGVAKNDGNAVVTLFTDGSPASVTGRDGKTAELTQERPCALLDAEGEEILPFGEYERLELISSAPRIAAAVSGDEAYLLDGTGERVSERYASVEVCRDSTGYADGTNLLHIVGTDGGTFSVRVSSEGELSEEPEHPKPSAENLSSGYVVDRMMRVLDPFFDALRIGDRSGIEAVIGEEKYEEAVALIDTLESDYEPCQDYEKPLTEQSGNKYMAWLLKNARYVSMPGIAYWETVDLGGDGAYLMAEIRFAGQEDIIYAGASFGTAENSDGVYPLIGFYLSVGPYSVP